MNNAKQIIIKNLSAISDDIQDEFEILENLYKLVKLEKSRQSVKEEGSYSTEDVRQYFQDKYEEILRGTDTSIGNDKKNGVLI